MKDIQLLREIGEIDEKFAEEALTRKSRPPVRVRIARWGAVAACLALTVAIGIIAFLRACLNRMRPCLTPLALAVRI